MNAGVHYGRWAVEIEVSLCRRGPFPVRKWVPALDRAIVQVDAVGAFSDLRQRKTREVGMRRYGWIRLVVFLTLVTTLLCVPGIRIALAKDIKEIVTDYQEEYLKNPTAAVQNLQKKDTVAALQKNPGLFFSLMGQKLSTEVAGERIGAASGLKAFLETFKKPEELNTFKGTHFSAFETLKTHLVRGFQQRDSTLKSQVYDIWEMVFQDENLFAAVSLSPQKIAYKTPYFFVHAGGILLNPYTIKKNDEDRFMLEESGDTEARFFVEALYRNRYAWQDKAFKRYTAMDYEMRLGVAGADNDPTGAVVSGAGDAYMEFSIGKLVPCIEKGNNLHCLNNLERAPDEGVKWVTNLEALIGFVTDKGAQDLHFYWGVGPVVTVGIPFLTSEKQPGERTIEILGGVYFGQTDKPQFVDSDTREVKSKNDYPEFALEGAAIWRGDIRLPTGKNGFLTMGGRFISNLEGEGINPWSVAIGYTIPVEVIAESVSRLMHQ
jgi:hypothetical protein